MLKKNIRREFEDILTNNSFVKIAKNYRQLLTVFIVLTIIFFASTIILVENLFSIKELNKASYLSKSKTTYKINLNNTELYNTTVLNSSEINGDIPAKIIDFIDINFNYYYKSNRKLDITFKYKITSKLTIEDDEKILYTKDYNLLNETIINNKNKDLSINETINIDYIEYLDIANSIKSAYGKTSKSKLTIYMHVDKNSNYDFKEMDKDIIAIEIPLENKTSSVSLKVKNIDNVNTITLDSNIIATNWFYIVIIIFTTGLTIFYTFKTIRLITSNNGITYNTEIDKYIKNIFNTYNLLIIKRNDMPIFQNKEVIKFKTFNELLNIQKVIKVPINYYCIIKHDMSIFYIEYNNILYTYTIKNKEKIRQLKKTKKENIK